MTRHIARCKFLYLLLLPVLLDVLIFRYSPMYGLILAFKRYSFSAGIWGSKWVGFINFQSFFKSPYAWRVIRNTLFISGYLILFAFPMPILLALTLNEVRANWFKKTVQTISYMPYFISSVIIASIVNTILSPDGGAVNIILQKLGMKPVYFMVEQSYFRAIYTVTSIWRGVGFGAIIYIAAIANVNPELYEAAEMDGASRLKMIWHITLPGISGVIIIQFILRIGGILTVDWMDIMLYENRLIREVTDVIGTFIYKRGLEDLDYGFSTALNLMSSVVGFIMVLGSNAMARRYSEYYLL